MAHLAVGLRRYCVPIIFLFAAVFSFSGWASVLVEDSFSGASPDSTKFDWSGQVNQNGAGQLSLSTDTANTSWITSKAGASLSPGQTLTLNFTAYAYAENWNPGVYGNKQPRGMRVGTDANNVLEFYSISRVTIGLRARLNGSETILSYPFPAGVDSMHQYEITVTTTGAVFRVDGLLAGTILNNIPTGRLNFHMATYDGGAGNVPVVLDAVQLALTSSLAAPFITTEPANQTASVGANSAFWVIASGSEPLSYLWKRNGTNLVDGINITGVTTTNLTLSNVQTNDAGDYTVVVTNPAGSVTSTVATLTVDRLAQTITFPSLPGKQPGDAPFALGATASSGLAVSYTSSDTNVATVSGNVVTVVGTGSSLITAVQSGDATYLAATPVAQTLTVAPTPPIETGDFLCRQAVAGGNYGLTIRTDGTLWAWGNNNFVGQLGDGSTTGRSLPVPISLATNWQSVVAGFFHSFGIRSDGTLWAWGRNSSGQLGIGTTNNSLVPVQVGLDSNWKSVSAGGTFSLGVKSDGTLWIWGWNIGSVYVTNISAVPMQVGNATNWQSASAGWDHALAIKTDATLWGWGQNIDGQLGDGTRAFKPVPVQIGSAAWLTVAAGYQFSGAIKTDGTLWMWGAGNDGRLGDGTWTDQYSPVQIGTAADWRLVTVGQYDALAIKNNGTLWYSSGTYSQANADTNWLSVSERSFPPVALKTDGTLWVFSPYVGNPPAKIGAPAILVQPTNVASYVGMPAQFVVHVTGSAPLYSQWFKDGTSLMDGGRISGVNSNCLTLTGAQSTDEGLYFLLVSNAWGCVTSTVVSLTITDLGFLQIAGGGNHVTAIKNDSTLWSWGHNNSGQLGNGTRITTNLPFQVGAPSLWRSVSAGSEHTTAIKTDGTLWAWGLNGYGQLGNGTLINTNLPVQIGVSKNWQVVVAGENHNLAVTAERALYAWGHNYYGQLGDGTTVNRSTPIQIGTDWDWASLAAGTYHSIAIKTDGSLWAWGLNSVGQVGDGTTVNRSLPTQIGLGALWQKATAGQSHSMAIKTDGTLWSWGNNGSGQLGIGSTETRLLPVQVGPGSSWISIAAGVTHSAAVKTDGTLWLWGGNSHGELGDGTTSSKFIPVQLGFDTDWQAVAAGDYFTIGLKRNGTVWVWGMNTYRQVSEKTVPNILSPSKLGSPVILAQPIYSTNSAGTAVFVFTPSGSAPLSYQWFKNGTALVNGATISGATSASLVIANMAPGLADTFTVAVSNAYGCVLSMPARFVAAMDSFGPAAGISGSAVYSLARQSDGRLVVGGNFSALAGVARNYVGRLNENGTLDASFSAAPTAYVNALVMQPDGKVLIGGDFKYLNGLAIKRIGRVNADGTVDTAFNPSINTQGSDYSSAKSLAVLPNGQILVGGTFNQISLVSRVNFGRVNANGSLDGAYVLHADNAVQCIALQPDGKILVGGSFTALGGQPRSRIARLNADGSLDYLFDPGTDGQVKAMAVQPDGKILVGGQFSVLAGRSCPNLGRLNSDGTLDPTFDTTANGPVNAIVLQSNGRILVGGAFGFLGNEGLSCLGLLNPDGRVDARFAPRLTGQNGVAVNALALQPDNKLVVGGTFDFVDGFARTNLCRLSVPDPILLIVQQPTNTSCALGGTAVLSAVVEGAGPLGFQWLKDGAPLSSNGRISGVASNVLTVTDVQMGDGGWFSLSVSNSAQSLVSSEVLLKVLMPNAPTNVTANPLPFGTVGRGYGHLMTAAGGTAPYTWTIAAGSLPPGLGLSSDGSISGAPTVATNALFTIRVTGADGAYAEDDYAITIFTAPVIAAVGPLPYGRTGRAYSQTLSASGGVMPYSWDLASEGLPTGLTLSTGGVISGTPATPTNATFSVRITTANGVSSTSTFSLNIILETTLLVEDFEHAGAIPSGWSQESASGSASWVFQKGGNGSPLNSHGGIYNALLYGVSGNSTRLVTRMIDFGTNTAAQLTFWLDMKTYILGQDTMSVYYKTSANGPWVLLENYIYCPSWSQKTLNLPLPGSTYYIAFEGHTFGGYGICVDDVAITATVEPVAPTIISTAVPSGTTGVPYQFSLQASGGTLPYLWTLASGSLPQGLSLGTAGVISGTPARSGNSALGIRVTGQDGLAFTNQFQLAINPVSTTDNPVYMFTTFVGGSSGSKDGTNDLASFSAPTGLCLDSSNNLYVADSWNHTIRKVTPSGVTTTFAGFAGASGTNDGAGSLSRFNHPAGLAADANNQIYVADKNNNTIRGITPGGTVFTLAGRAGWSGYDPTNGTYYLNQPSGVTTATNGNLYVADTLFSTIVEVVAPYGNLAITAGWEHGYADGTNAGAKFSWPEGIVSSLGVLFVADTGNNVIRKVTLDGVVTTVAGAPGATGSADGTNGSVRFNHLAAITADSKGNLFVVDRDDHTIRRITTDGVVTTIGGGAGIPGRRDGLGLDARFYSPQGITVDKDGTLYVADSGNNRIVKGSPQLPPLIQVTWNGNQINLAWPLHCLGWELQVQTGGLDSSWSPVEGSTNTTTISMTPGAFQGAVFYRLHKP